MTGNVVANLETKAIPPIRTYADVVKYGPKRAIALQEVQSVGTAFSVYYFCETKSCPTDCQISAG